MSCAQPPPNYAVQIFEALNILEGYPIGSPGWEHNSVNHLHHFIVSLSAFTFLQVFFSLCACQQTPDWCVQEATKIAAADRALSVRTATDTPTEQFLSKDFAAARRETIRDTATPCPTDGARQLPAGAGARAARVEPVDPMAWFKNQGSTTHFDVIDAMGNALSCTQ